MTGFQISRNVAKRVAKRVTNLLGAFGKDKYASQKHPEQVNLDEDLRALWNNSFPTLFPSAPDQLLTPDFTTRQIVGKLRRNLFPLGTRFDVAGDDKARKYTTALQKVLKAMRWRRKVKMAIKEAALMGYCGIRTVYNDKTDKWITTVKRKEDLIIERDEVDPEDFIAISILWKEDSKGNECLWHKERWTDSEYQRWVPVKGNLDVIPEFKEVQSVEPNNYGIIPVSIIPHISDDEKIGVGVVRHDDILAIKSIIRLLQNRHDAHLQYLRPIMVRKNHADPDEPIAIGPASIVDIKKGNDTDGDVDLSTIEFAGVPDSARQEILDWIDNIYDNNGLTPPSHTKEFKAGGVVKSGTALKVLNEDEVDTIEDLREDGYSEITRHVEKILFMAYALQGPAWEPFNGLKLEESENENGNVVSAKFPPIYTSSDEERLQRITLLERSRLPNDEKAKREAEVFGIDDEKIIKEMETRFDEKDEAEKPTDPSKLNVAE